MFYIPHPALNIPLDRIDISCSRINDIDLGDVNSTIHTIFTAKKLVGRLVSKGDSYEDK